MNSGTPTKPNPTQDELYVLTPEVLLHEFQATFKNETAHMPEISLRYLLYLIFTLSTDNEELLRYAAQVRIDLNEERFKRDARFGQLIN